MAVPKSPSLSVPALGSRLRARGPCLQALVAPVRCETAGLCMTWTWLVWAWGGVLCLTCHLLYFGRDPGPQPRSWWMGVALRCPLDTWTLTGFSCLPLTLSSLLTTCKWCWVMAKLPLPPHSSTLLGGCPKGASWTSTFPLWDLGESPCLGAMPHGCHQGSPDPQRAGGWMLVAQAGGGRGRQPGKKPETARMKVLVGTLEASPAWALWPAELWALVAGEPCRISSLARAVGSGGPWT